MLNAYDGQKWFDVTIISHLTQTRPTHVYMGVAVVCVQVSKQPPIFLWATIILAG